MFWLLPLCPPQFSDSILPSSLSRAAFCPPHASSLFSGLLGFACPQCKLALPGVGCSWGLLVSPREGVFPYCPVEAGLGHGQAVGARVWWSGDAARLILRLPPVHFLIPTRRSPFFATIFLPTSLPAAAVLLSLLDGVGRGSASSTFSLPGHGRILGSKSF